MPHEFPLELLKKGAVIEAMEDFIDRGEKVYLITYMPDPKRLPDADFRVQHEFNVSLLRDYLFCCHAGLFCVESTQIGNPHYHGWYQIDEDREAYRICIMKTMQQMGDVKIIKCRSYKINCYTKKQNGLYYYKKDVFSSMQSIAINPISKYSESTIDWDSVLVSNFFNRDIKNPRRVEEVLSDVKFYKQFYNDSL